MRLGNHWVIENENNIVMTFVLFNQSEEYKWAGRK